MKYWLWFKLVFLFDDEWHQKWAIFNIDKLIQDKKERVDLEKNVYLWEKYKNILKLFEEYKLKEIELKSNLFDLTEEYPDDYFEYYSKNLTLYLFPTKNYEEIKDIFEEIIRLLRGNIEFLIPSQVKLELQRISLKQTSLGSRATRALEIIKKYKIICIENNSNADKAILTTSKQVKVAVATADSQLIKSLRAAKIPIITLRGDRLYCEPDTPEYWPSML